MASGARRGRPPRLTRETVARAVLDVGFPNLTFTAVREHLGVGESTLFRYAPDRDELVRLGLGLAMESVEMPPLRLALLGGPSRFGDRGVARGFRRRDGADRR